jgi:hypothetical protein
MAWNDAKSFKRHLETMRDFRMSHCTPAPGGKPFNSSPMAYDTHPSRGARVNKLIDATGDAPLIPIWEIESPAGAQN